jgi:probable regulatory domain-containing protein
LGVVSGGEVQGLGSQSALPESVEIDLSNVPLKPVGKKEISQLEMVLIIGTLYRPEVLELIGDPVERSTWIDSLAVAAGSLARAKAGMLVSQIADELGRTEATIKSHLSGKTKAGKLVAETYEKLRKGELKLVVPLIKAPIAGSEEEVKALREEASRLRERVKNLEDEVERLRARSAQLTEVLREREELATKYSELLGKLTAPRHSWRGFCTLWGFHHLSEPLTGAASCFSPRRQLRGDAGSSLAKLAHTQHQTHY